MKSANESSEWRRSTRGSRFNREKPDRHFAIYTNLHFRRGATWAEFKLNDEITSFQDHSISRLEIRLRRNGGKPTSDVWDAQNIDPGMRNNDRWSNQLTPHSGDRFEADIKITLDGSAPARIHISDEWPGAGPDVRDGVAGRGGASGIWARPSPSTIQQAGQRG
jgi:hypothetical protein